MSNPNVTPDLTNTPVVGTGITNAPPNVMPPTATAQNQAPVDAPVANAQPQPTQPQVQPTQNASPASNAPTPNQQHAGIFHQVLSLLGGGGSRPVQDANGQPVTDANGNVQMAPVSSKRLGMGILAGAISGMMAGMAAPTVRTPIGGGRSIPDYSGSFAAGANAAQKFTQEGAQTEAQKQADDIKSRQFATMDHNLKMHAMMIANHKADTEDQQNTVDTYGSMGEAMEGEYANGNVTDAQNNPIDLYSYRNIDGDKLQQLLASKDPKARATMEQVMPVQVIQVPQADGSMKACTLFDVYNPDAMVKMTENLKKDYPKLAGVGDNKKVPVRMIAQWAQMRANEGLAVSGLDDHIEGYNKANSGNPINKDFDLASAGKGDPSIQALYPLINKYRTDPFDAMVNDIRKDPAFANDAKIQAGLAHLQEKMGFTSDGLVNQDQARAEALAEGKKSDAQKPADSARIQNAPALIKARFTNLKPADYDDLNSRLHAGMSNAEYDAVLDKAFTQSEKYKKDQLDRDTHDLDVAAKQQAQIAKGEKPVVGVDAGGRQVLVPAGDVQKYGLSQVREVGQAENEKVTNARSLMTVFNNDDPDDLGIMQLAAKLDKDGKLGPAASRFQDWLNRSGSVITNLAGFDAGDPDVQRLFTKLGLSTTGLMQVHVGARGSAQMLEHFEDLAKAKSMSPQAFRAAIDTENSYVRMKAMLPQSGKAQATQASQPTQQNKDGNKGHGKFDPNVLPQVNQ